MQSSHSSPSRSAHSPATRSDALRDRLPRSSSTWPPMTRSPDRSKHPAQPFACAPHRSKSQPALRPALAPSDVSTQRHALGASGGADGTFHRSTRSSEDSEPFEFYPRARLAVVPKRGGPVLTEHSVPVPMPSHDGGPRPGWLPETFAEVPPISGERLHDDADLPGSPLGRCGRLGERATADQLRLAPCRRTADDGIGSCSRLGLSVRRSSSSSHLSDFDQMAVRLAASPPELPAAAGHNNLPPLAPPPSSAAVPSPRTTAASPSSPASHSATDAGFRPPAHRPPAELLHHPRAAVSLPLYRTAFSEPTERRVMPRRDDAGTDVFQELTSAIAGSRGGVELQMTSTDGDSAHGPGAG